MYAINHLPAYDLSTSTTGCCPVIDPSDWDDTSIQFEDKLFVKMKVHNFLHMPINFGAVQRKVLAAIKEAGAEAEEFVMLSRDTSPWEGEHLVAVKKEVPGLNTVRLSGLYLTKVFEGPFKDVGKWDKELTKFAQDKGWDVVKNYFFYTTCPGCAKEYGKNYVVGFSQVEM